MFETLETACRAATPTPRGSSMERRRLLLAHGFVWAALMIASALLLKKAAAPETYAWLLTLVFIPLSFASEQILRRALRLSDPRP
jgi:hypothetical protein